LFLFKVETAGICAPLMY